MATKTITSGKSRAAKTSASARPKAKTAAATKPRQRQVKPGHFLKDMAFKKEWRCFKKGRLLEFRPGVNLLVGDQGAGKSTVLELMHDLARAREAERTKKIISVSTEACRVVCFDFEHENPRTMSYFMEGAGQFMFQMQAKFKSHGETVNALLADLERSLEKPLKGKRRPTKALILLDEPDMALSPRSAYAMVKRLDALAAKGHQIIAAVHNPIVISSQPEVLSLEHKKWMTPQAFLAKHAESAQ